MIAASVLVPIKKDRLSSLLLDLVNILKADISIWVLTRSLYGLGHMSYESIFEISKTSFFSLSSSS